jgi:hypothetical protein
MKLYILIVTEIFLSLLYAAFDLRVLWCLHHFHNSFALPMTWFCLRLIGGSKTRVCSGVKRCHLRSCGLVEVDLRRSVDPGGLLIGAFGIFDLGKHPRSIHH